MRAMKLTLTLLTSVLFALCATFAHAQRSEPVTEQELQEIRAAFQSVQLSAAQIERAADGRATLTGTYETRDQVEEAFAIARSVLGYTRVAPTTPANINLRLKGFQGAFASTVGNMMRAAPKRAESPPASQNVPTAQMPTSQSDNAPLVGVRTETRGNRTFGLIVGIGAFKHLPKDKRLDFAVKDASDFHNFLTRADGGNVERQFVALISDDRATAGQVRRQMDETLGFTQSGDTMIIFIASHGVPNAMDKFDIVMHDTEFPTKRAGGKQQIEFANAKRSTALTDEDLQRFVARLVAKQVRTVLILDTCYSGKTFASIPGFLPTRTRSLVQHQREVAVTASPSQSAINEMVQQAGKDNKTTRVVIVSASETEEAMESSDVGGGVFTQTYISALNQVPDYADAFDRAKPAIIKKARAVGHSQTPRLLVVPESAYTKMR
jgi:hypothetical protein